MWEVVRLFCLTWIVDHLCHYTEAAIPLQAPIVRKSYIAALWQHVTEVFDNSVPDANKSDLVQ